MKASVRQRRSVPISAFVGANGSGKSALAVESLRHSLVAGRPVLSAVRLLDGSAPAGADCVHPLCDAKDHGQPGHVPSHPSWVPLRRMAQLLEFAEDGRGDVFLDEVGALVSSRESQSLPPQIAALLQQLRKGDNRLIWTAPSWARADKILREVTMLATVCKGYGDRTFPDREWKGRRLIHAVSYHAADLDEFEVAKVQNGRTATRPRRQSSQWVRVIKLEATRWYDTFEPTASIGFSSLGGTCVSCGGRRVAPKCSCDEHSQPDTSVHLVSPTGHVAAA